MKLALLVFILFPLISFAQTDQKLIPEFEVSSGKLSNIVPQVLEELNLTYIIGAVNLPKRKEIRQHTFINTSVQEILDYLLDGTRYRLEYSTKDQTVSLIDRRIVDEITITGRVQSSDSGGGIVDVHVTSSDNKYQAVTDETGFYSIRVPKTIDSLMLSFSHIQFVNASGWVLISNAFRKDKIVYNKFLRFATVEIDTYIIHKEAKDLPALPFFSNNSLEKVFFGVSLDPTRFLFLSGVDQFFRMEGGISYKGSPSTTNQFLLDGERLMDPFKLKGSISIFEDEVTKGLKIYEGVSPARYEGSSLVVDVLSEDGNVSEPKRTINFSDQYFSVTLTGPIENNTSSYFLNFRSSLRLTDFNRDFQMPSFLNSPFFIPTEFTEVIGKLSAYVNRDNIFSFTTAYSCEVIKDHLDPLLCISDLNLVGIENNELNVIAKWDNRSFTNVKLNLSGSYKHFNKSIALREQNNALRNFAPKGLQDEISFKGAVELGVKNNLALVAGFSNNLVFYSYSADKVSSIFQDSVIYDYTELFKSLDGEIVNSLSGFVELNRSLDKLSFSLGLRLTDLSNLKGFNTLEPRFIFKYRPNLDHSNILEVNYGRNLITEYSMFSNDLESYKEYSFIVTALSTDSLKIAPYVSNELNINYKVVIRNKLFLEFGHFVKTSKNLLSDANSNMTEIDPKMMPFYTMLGISVKGAIQLNEAWYFSALYAYKDFINIDNSLSAINFKYKYGLLIRNKINKKIGLVLNVFNYKEGFTDEFNGRVLTFDLGMEWKVNKHYMLGLSCDYSISKLHQYGNLLNFDLKCILEF